MTGKLFHTFYICYTTCCIPHVAFIVMWRSTNQGRIQDLKLGGREMWSGGRVPKALAWTPKAPTGVGSKILACSPSKWCILMHSGARLGQIIATTMFMTSAELGLIVIMKITVCAMRTISTLK